MEQAPIFIKIDQYKNVLDIIEVLKAKVKEAKNQLGKIQQMKSEEDSELDEWAAELEEVEKRVEGIDRSLLRV